tara:strand:+ start:101 stop:337 length:237 start_codon:yes stop_codon:yes gene_type:complete
MSNKPKYKPGDLVYTYQNPKHLMAIERVRGEPNDFAYRLVLKTNEHGHYDPYGESSKSSKWIDEASVSNKPIPTNQGG